VRRTVVTAERLAGRRAHYFMDQQIGLHGTILSIALGVAGLAAASLFEVRPADRPYQLLLWLLWLVSLLAVGTVYSGMTVNVYAYPSTVPDALDMFLPFGLGLAEFMLFAVLAALNDQLSPRLIVAVWFGCLCLFGCFSCVAVQRVRYLLRNTGYDPPELQVAVDEVVSLMRTGLRGASGTAVASAVAAILIGWVRAVPLGLAYVVAALLLGGMSVGVINQRRQARILEAAMSRLAAVGAGAHEEADAAANVGLTWLELRQLRDALDRVIPDQEAGPERPAAPSDRIPHRPL
jgi:hypothetical protein